MKEKETFLRSANRYNLPSRLQNYNSANNKKKTKKKSYMNINMLLRSKKDYEMQLQMLSFVHFNKINFMKIGRR